VRKADTVDSNQIEDALAAKDNSMLKEVVELLEGFIDKIPANFWGVAVGSLFALGGVFLTNRSNNTRLREQLEHDRKLRRKERELALRKEIYLAAAEAIAEGLRAILRYCDLEIPHRDISKAFVEKASSIAKIHVVATEDTARAVGALMGELDAAFLRLSVKRYPLDNLKNQLKIGQVQIDNFARTRDEMVDLMRKHNIEGTNNEKRMQVRNGTFQFEQKRVADTIEQQNKRQAEIVKRTLEYFKDCFAEHKEVAKLVIPVIAAVRAEIELPVNMELYGQIFKDLLEKQEGSLAEFFQAIVQPAKTDLSPPPP
jgi:hypothetical protein